ncbi:MAG: excinuclease ABC subunit UvrA [Candidatus Margulisiibacteriota bacterium]
MLNQIKIDGARVHNLKNVSVALPRNKLVVFTGLSGSGKSSLAFDTIYAEGQRRYMESLSAYARQFLDQMDKPDVDRIEGLSPAISIDQKSSSHNPRSTVGTITEIYDYLRLLFASVGKPHCPTCDRPIQHQSIQEMADAVMAWGVQDIMVLSPVVSDKKGEYKDLFEQIKKEGFSRVRVNGEILRVDQDITLDKKKKHRIDIVVDRLETSEDNRARVFESIEAAAKQSKGQVVIHKPSTAEDHLFSETMACPHCNLGFSEISPRLFSFNTPIGACPTCNGLGDTLDFDPDLVIETPTASLKTCTAKIMNLNGTIYGNRLATVAKQQGFSISTPFNTLTEAQRNWVLYGQEKAMPENPYVRGRIVTDTYEALPYWEGILNNLRRRYIQTQSEGMRFFFQNYMSAKSCTTCKGARLKPLALAVKIGDESIHQLTRKSVSDLLAFFDALAFTQKEQDIIKQVRKEIVERLQFLDHVGLGYLNLERRSGTLSGGEFQRIRLATQIGSGLTGVLYVLDEPSIGLHQRDNQRLIETLVTLRDLGNTLIVVEHDEDMIRKADFVVDIGPGAGKLGGTVLFAGPFDKLLKHPTSQTAAYLSGKQQIEVPKKRRSPKKDQAITIVGATENNLKNLTVSFPLGQFIGVTGVSGSGKSTLINDILHKALMRHFFKSKERPGAHTRIDGLEHIDKLITIDQSPIGRTPRSNPATYTGVFGPIRDLYAQTREAKIRGYQPGRFSFNVKGGRCEACEGDGVVKIEMHFLSDVYVTCDVCKGKRYNDQTLEVTYKGYTIADVLNMTVAEGLEVFANIPPIVSKLNTLMDVGLGYIHIGQNATTLSGGEAQRIKLSKELSKRSTGKTLYLLDEPTTGLHFADIHQLLGVLNRLVDAGNTVIVIEHNLDVIKTADHLIDLGPEGGAGGGQLLVTGTPETVAKCKTSHTGQFLKTVLK